MKDHEETIGELEEENAGVYELLTEQRALDTISVTSVKQTEKHSSEQITVSQRDYVLCSRCKDKLGADKDTKPSKLGK